MKLEIEINFFSRLALERAREELKKVSLIIGCALSSLHDEKPEEKISPTSSSLERRVSNLKSTPGDGPEQDPESVRAKPNLQGSDPVQFRGGGSNDDGKINLPQYATKLTIADLEAAVPKDHWIKLSDVCAKLKATPFEVRELMKDPTCGVWNPYANRVAWRPAVKLGSAPKERQRSNGKIGPDPTFGLPSNIGFPPKERLPEANFPPMHERAVEIGKTLVGAFSRTDLGARLGGNFDQAGKWILSWLDKKWVVEIGYNLYERTEKFGK